MPATRWLIGFLVCFLVAVPGQIAAQQTNGREKAEDYAKDAFKDVFGMNVNLSVHGGYTEHGRFLLQRVATESGDRERALSSSGGYNIGGSIGLDFLPQVGARLSYTYGANDLSFRGDDGDGSRLLDIDAVARVATHLATAELLRYMLPARSAFNAYGGAGFAASWWNLEQKSDLVQPTGGFTQFRFGALAIIGLQVKLGSRFDVRAEASTASVRNPFSGGESYTAHGGVTIDEPTRVSQRDFKLVFMYNFRKPASTQPLTNGNK